MSGGDLNQITARSLPSQAGRDERRHAAHGLFTCCIHSEINTICQTLETGAGEGQPYKEAGQESQGGRVEEEEKQSGEKEGDVLRVGDPG